MRHFYKIIAANSLPLACAGGNKTSLLQCTIAIIQALTESTCATAVLYADCCSNTEPSHVRTKGKPLCLRSYFAIGQLITVK